MSVASCKYFVANSAREENDKVQLTDPKFLGKVRVLQKEFPYRPSIKNVVFHARPICYILSADIYYGNGIVKTGVGAREDTLLLLLYLLMIKNKRRRRRI